MIDLNSTTFYKVRFIISRIDPEQDLLWRLVCHIKSWQTNKWNRQEKLLSDDAKDWSYLKKGGKIVSVDNKTVAVSSAVCYMPEPAKNNTYWACQIIETPFSEYEFAPRRWVTEVGYEPIDENKAYFSCVISYSDRPGFIGECEPMPLPNIPGLIKRIIDDKTIECYCGADKISIAPQKIENGGWMNFWEKLKSEERNIPYIYISPKNNFLSEADCLYVDPENIAKAVGGNALVFYATSKVVTDEMNFFTPQELACYNGMIRIYYPGVKPTDELDYTRHRYFHPDQIETMGEGAVCQILRRALAQDMTSCDKFFRIDDCRAMVEANIRKKRLKELQSAHQEKLKEVENESMSLAMEEEEKKLIAEAERDRLRAELDGLKEENFRLTLQNESYRSLAKDNAALQKAVSSRLSTKDYPKTHEDVVNYFEATFGDKIQFTDDARRTLKTCSIDLSDLWEALFALATVMWDLYFTKSGDIYKEFKMQTGIKATRGEGSMTRADAKLMRQFVTDYNGESIDIEAHITYPQKKQSIHFGFSDKDKRIIVGSCGAHKEVYSSEKRK